MCAQCGFPARATGREIARAKAEYGSRAAQVSQVDLRPEATHRGLLDLLVPLSTWRRVVAITGVALAAGGGVVVKIAWSFAGLRWGALALAAGLTIAGLAAAERGRTDSFGGPG